MNTQEKSAPVILITGASGGLAQEIIRQLPRESQLILQGRSRQKLEELYSDLPQVAFFQLDIRDAQAIETFVADIYQTYGRIDYLINNAGFGEFKDFDRFSNDTIQEMFDVNTLATLHFSRLVGQKMAEAGRGHMITIASMAGLIASSKSSIYSATKFAVIGFSNALRLELADKNVFVTTVNPGPIRTHFFDQADPSGDYLKSVARFTLEPEDVARRIVKIMGTNKRELNMPFMLKLAAKCYTLFPRISDFLARKVFNYK